MKYKKINNEDITDQEFEKLIKPFYDNYDDYIEIYILPEIIAYYIANSYYRNIIGKTTFIQEYNSAKDLINIINVNYHCIKKEVIKLLRIKYALTIISEDPLIIKKIEYQPYN